MFSSLTATRFAVLSPTGTSVVRGLAAGEPWASVGDICSDEIAVVRPDDEASDAVA